VCVVTERMTARIVLQLEPSAKARFEAAMAKRERTMSQQLRGWIDKWLETYEKGTETT
jgi:hypothetical protein